MTEQEKSRFRFGPFEVDLAVRELRKSGSRVKLSGQPFEILTALLERPGELVTRDELRKRIWSENTFVDFSHGLNAAVNKLRDALCDSAEEPRYIETLPRRGYRFIAPIEIVAPQPEVSVAPQVPVPLANPVWNGLLVDNEWQATVPVKRQTIVQLSSVIAGIVLIAFGLAGIWAHYSDSPSVLETKRKLEQAINPMPHETEHFLQQAKQAAEQSALASPGILHLQLAADHSALNANSLTRVISGHDAIAGPQLSPDGKKLAFMSGRNENMEIWVSNPDGSAMKKLTSMDRTGTPRWSPDSRFIAFDSDARSGRSGIYVVSADTGDMRAVVEDQWNNSVPSWSRDGNWIYFASNRAQDWEDTEIWKVPVGGGQPLQVTHHGGFAAFESVDGKTLFYAKSRYENPELRQIPVDGGPETRVSTLVNPSTWASWAVTEKGILFLSGYNEHASDLQYFNFDTRTARSLTTLEKASFWLSASADGTSVWYSELTDDQARQVFKAALN